MKAKILFMFCLVLLLVGGFKSAVYPQDKGYPNKPIEIIVNISAGGGFDRYFRLFSEELKKIWKVPINVVNKVGGGGLIAMMEVANTKKDGYTLLAGAVGGITAVSIADPSKIHLIRNFDPLHVNYGFATDIIVTGGESNFRSLEDVVDYARKKPGELIIGTAATGTNVYLEARLFIRSAKVDITHIPFPGSAEVVTNLLGGHIHLGAISDATGKPYIEAGKMRGLVATLNKSLIFPSIPTYAEKGFPQVDLIVTAGILGPKGLPPAVIKTWENATVEILKKPEFVASLNKMGYFTNFLIGTEKLNNFLKEDIEKYSRFTPEELGWKK